MKQLNVTLFFGACWLISVFFSCQEASPIPKLTFKEVSRQAMQQGGADSLFLTFDFIDGDGNVGSDTNNIQVLDSRTDELLSTHRMPDFVNNVAQERSGTITLVLRSPCCVYPNGTRCQSSTQYPTQTMRYQVRLIDQAGNWSNTIESSTIVLECD